MANPRSRKSPSCATWISEQWGEVAAAATESVAVSVAETETVAGGGRLRLDN
jgi:hypothetical protein